MPSPSFRCAYSDLPECSIPTPVSALPPSHRPPISTIGVRYDSSNPPRRVAFHHQREPLHVARRLGQPVVSPGFQLRQQRIRFQRQIDPSPRQQLLPRTYAPSSISKSVFTSPASSRSFRSPQPAPNNPHIPNPGRGLQCAYGSTLVSVRSTPPPRPGPLAPPSARLPPGRSRPRLRPAAGPPGAPAGSTGARTLSTTRPPPPTPAGVAPAPGTRRPVRQAASPPAVQVEAQLAQAVAVAGQARQGGRPEGEPAHRTLPRGGPVPPDHIRGWP